MKPRTIVIAVLAGSAACAATAATPRDGKQVYESTCIACHGTGANGAPKVGDTKAWKPLADRGLASLSANALEGVRKMPPHGGRLDLSDLEIERGITYMVNQ